MSATRNATGRYGSLGNSVSFDKDVHEASPHDLYDEPPSEGSVPRHTQFLDLTNGEGGGRDNDFSPESVSEEPTPETTRPTTSSLKRPARYDGVDPNTPGKVVETGQEHTGRWTREEHEAFLGALQMYGKEWKKVAAKVKTRTVVQTRTHAQKYFQKLQKVVTGSEGKGEVAHVEMGVAVEAKKASAQKKKRLPRQQSASTHAAAHLMTNLSSVPQSTTAAASPSSYASGNAVAHSSGHFPTPHGFSTPSSVLTNEQSIRQTHPIAYPVGFGSSGEGWKSMKIKAPDPDHAFSRGKFPEPSPAACGKRKVAEIAAARMLAGVAASGGSTGKAKKHASISDHDTPPPSDVENAVEGGADVAKGVSLQIVNPESLGVAHSGNKKRRGLDGEASPTTPWDGQLEALVSEAKSKECLNIADNLEDDIDNDGAMEPDSYSYPLTVCGPGSLYGRSELHKAVCEINVATVSSCAEEKGSAIICQPDERGYFPIHTASSLRMVEPTAAAAKIVRILLSNGADASCVDSNGNTPLHWAARSGDEDVAHMLLMKNCPPDAQNKQGETPLHWALRVGRTGMAVTAVLLKNGARCAIFSKKFKRPLDVAAERFPEEATDGLPRSGSSCDLKATEKVRKISKSEQKKLQVSKIEETRETRANFLALSPKARTLVLHHPECLEHIPKSESDWEAPDRVNSIMRRIIPPEGSTETTGIFGHEVTVSSDFEKAEIDLLSRVHSAEYLAFVNSLSKDLERKRQEALSETTGEDDEVSDIKPVHAAGVPFTPMVQKSMMKFDNVKQASHSDTSFSAGSLRAARRAAGAVQHAVDRVLVGRDRNAFCVVRPPGHHAGVQGLLDGGESCGFCIFNNVAAGAMHAISDERLICERCAIVDIDAHHGNGTEEIVKKCHDPARLFFFSIHLFDNDKRKNNPYKFYPGTGDEDDIAHNIINVPIAPLWKQQRDTPTQGPAAPKTFHNTRRKAKAAAAAPTFPPPPPFGDDSVLPPSPLPPPDDSPRDSTGGYESSSEYGGVGLESARTSDAESASQRSTNGASNPGASSRFLPGSGRHAYRRAIQHRLIPALRAFNPDLILISAGFDAAKGDVGNAKHMIGRKEKMGMDLLPSDYGWATRKILEVADICCQGRVVSVLEGGYGRTPIVPSGDVTSSDDQLDKGLFSECAVRHLQAMIDPYDAEARFSS